ncbi:TetR/AcrR family transcriptional regulator [Sphingomonas sp.]|uniref:TetR/AcrR family transcriptional regulator n=1 Tax=Sphingomonas sp. TaxID=28214 RepID=UPI0031D0EC1C
MSRRSRPEMIAETRAKLIAAARQAFAAHGYAEASMDDLTAAAGLTRGALYHHFGGKQGLLEAVIEQIDGEMAERLAAVAAAAPTRWEGLVQENIGYIELALEPDVQRIMLRDGPAVLGDPANWPSALACIASIRGNIERLQADGVIRADLDAEAAARMITGSSTDAALWIANSADPAETSRRVIPAFRAMLEGLLDRPERL